MTPGRHSHAKPTITAVCAAALLIFIGEQALADNNRGFRDRPPIWNELAPNERGFLEHHSERWHTYPPSVRQRLRGQARRLMEMDAEQVERLRQQRRAFRRLPPQRQRALCRQFQQERGYLPSHCLNTR